ncbi:MAG TPA: WYL domain-containing protein [Bacilli bacterium]|nr:WYL domain-containing protein [Bacilli bacterium]
MSNLFVFTEEGRQHINLSTRAMEIIERDMIYFNDDYDLKNKSGFINQIIANYYDQFPLAMDVALKQIASIKETLEGEKFEQKLTRRVIEELNNEIMKNLINEYSKKYPSDVQFKLKLNKANISLLEELEEAKYFNDFAPRSGASFYLKIMLESYSNLLVEERERIFFKETISVVERAIKNNTIIQFKFYEQNLRIAPLGIHRHHDQQSLTLFAVDEEPNEFSGPRIYNDIKVKELYFGNVRELKTHKAKKGFDLSQDNLDTFLDVKKSSRETQTFTIKFTPGGLKRFWLEEDRLPFVGIKSRDDGHLYTFKTTETHIFLHFFKYGGQALIISPEDVRDRFARLYKASYEKYEKQITNEANT